MRIALAIAFAISACGKSAPTPEETTGSALTIDDVSYVFPYHEMLGAYMVGIVQGLSAWDGDCTKQLERMQELDVLYDEIRNGKARVPPALIAEVQAKMVASIDEQLTWRNETGAHLEATVSEIKLKCPRQDVVAEMNKIFAVVKSP
jgi:hypothetical protein